MPPAAPPAPADRFSRIIEALCLAVARRCGLGGLAGPLVILIWSRLRRIAARFTRLAERGPTPSRMAAPRPSPAPKPRTRAPLYPPRGFAALLRLVPEAAPIAAQLRHLLADPDMTALLATAPELRRILRPLCRMLGIRLTAAASPAAKPPPKSSTLTQPPPPIPPPATPLPVLLRSLALNAA